MVKKVNMTMKPKVHERAKIEAIRLKVTLSNFVESLIEQYFKDKRSKEK